MVPPYHISACFAQKRHEVFFFYPEMREKAPVRAEWGRFPPRAGTGNAATGRFSFRAKRGLTYLCGQRPRFFQKALPRAEYSAPQARP